MRIRDIEIVLAAAELGSFTRAADRMRLSQPAVSLAVKRLEESLGVSLFDRQPGHLKLSDAGAAALRDLRKIHDIYRFSLHRGGGRRRVGVGLSSLLCGCDISQLVARLERVGGYAVTLMLEGSDALQRRGDLDVAIHATELASESAPQFSLPAEWIGVDNGVFIHSTKEHALWDAAIDAMRRVRRVERVVEVNDCVFAYALAAAGVGATPCVAVGLPTAPGIAALPPLPAVRFAVQEDDVRLRRVAEDWLGSVLSCAGVAASPHDAAAHAGQAPPGPSAPPAADWRRTPRHAPVAGVAAATL